jgi:hypothetical protein
MSKGHSYRLTMHHEQMGAFQSDFLNIGKYPSRPAGTFPPHVQVEQHNLPNKESHFGWRPSHFARKQKSRFHQCISVLIACRKTLEILHLQDAVDRPRQDRILFDNWNSKELNMGFPALQSLTVTLWHLPLLPALLVSSPHLTSLTFVDTGIYFKHQIYYKRYPQLAHFMHSGKPINRHTIQNVAIEAGCNTDFDRMLLLLHDGVITAQDTVMTIRHAKPTSLDLVSWRMLLPFVQGSRFFSHCKTISFPCSEVEMGTELLSSMSADFRSRLRWTDSEVPHIST